MTLTFNSTFPREQIENWAQVILEEMAYVQRFLARMIYFRDELDETRHLENQRLRKEIS